MKVVIQPGIYQGPIQAFTALCSTKIVPATVIQRQACFGWKLPWFISRIFYKFLPQTRLFLNVCSGHNFCATECSKSLDWTLADTWLNADFFLEIKISRIF